jgi:nucleoside-diphosphate-sugar epimerase
LPPPGLYRTQPVLPLPINLVATGNVIHAIKDTDLDGHLVKFGTMGVYGTPKIDAVVAT